jgi:hypothetical protein
MDQITARLWRKTLTRKHPACCLLLAACCFFSLASDHITALIRSQLRSDQIRSDQTSDQTIRSNNQINHQICSSGYGENPKTQPAPTAQTTNQTPHEPNREGRKLQVPKTSSGYGENPKNSRRNERQPTESKQPKTLKIPAHMVFFLGVRAPSPPAQIKSTDDRFAFRRAKSVKSPRLFPLLACALLSPPLPFSFFHPPIALCP